MSVVVTDMQSFGLTYSCRFETKPREPALKPLGATTWLDNRFLPDSRSVKTGQVTGQGLTPDLMDLADLTEHQAQSSKVKCHQPNGANYWCVRVSPADKSNCHGGWLAKGSGIYSTNLSIKCSGMWNIPKKHIPRMPQLRGFTDYHQ